LATHHHDTVFYQQGDCIMSAHYIDLLFNNRTKSNSLSGNSIATAEERHSYEKIIKNQIEIYKKILELS